MVKHLEETLLIHLFNYFYIIECVTLFPNQLHFSIIVGYYYFDQNVIGQLKHIFLIIKNIIVFTHQLENQLLLVQLLELVA